MGIEPAFLPHVFDRFRQADSTTTRPQNGLGLGLAIVHYLIEQHKGSVRAESPGVNQGATFTVTLPLLDPMTDGSSIENNGYVTQDAKVEANGLEGSGDSAPNKAMQTMSTTIVYAAS
jgi:hypothetical protein